MGRIPVAFRWRAGDKRSLPESNAPGLGPTSVRASDAPAGIRRSTRYLPELESLRGIAILLVFWFHTDRAVRVFAPQQASLWYAFVRAGHTGVDLFFVLSAFLLSLPFLREGCGGPRVNRRRFFARRALRILPLYWMALAVAILLKASTLAQVIGAAPRLILWPAFLSGPTFLPPFPDLHPYSNTWWSLSTEAQFYVLLPFLPFLVGDRRWRWGVVVLGGYALAYAGFLSRRLPTAALAGNELALGFSVFGRGWLFAWGIAAAFVFQTWGDRLRRLADGRWWRRGGGDVALLTTLFLLGQLLRWAVCCREPWDLPPDHAWHVLEGGLWAIVVLLLLLAPLRLRPLFHNRLLSTLGILSYSIYMIHAPFLDVALGALRSPRRPLVGWSLQTGAVVGVLSLGTVGLSWLTYRLIERPFLREKARLDD